MTATGEQLLTAISGHDRTSPLVAALLALMGEHYALNTASVSLPDLTDAARHYNAGRVAAVQDLRDDLEAALAESARRRQA